MAPNSVAAPVPTTRQRAVPLRTFVPRCRQLVRFASGVAAGTGPVDFCTGKLSPVSTASLTKQSAAASSRQSAGTTLPADSSITSPRTMSWIGTEHGCPSRSVEVCTCTLARKSAAADCARYSRV